MTLTRSNPRAKPRWVLLGVGVLVLTLAGALATQGAPLDKTLFELDGDATNDTTYTKVGVLNAAVATATAGSTTAITICQEPATFANGTTILVDAERMTLNGGANATGGGCPSAFPNKRNYTATRGADGTTPGAHAKAEDVSLIDTGAFSGADWDQVYANINDDPDSKCDADALIDLGAVECFFQSDGRATSIFTQAKDYDEISDTSGVWQWRDQSVPDANELDDAFAIKYVDGDLDQHLFFGADRFATNGTKDAGFWFFHADVAALDPVGTADGLFSGVHTPPDPGSDGFCNPASGGVGGGPLQTSPNCGPGGQYDDNDTAGDVLILTTFTGGGAVTTVRVFEWIGPAGSTAALLERGVQGDCVPGSGTQELCATVNDTTVETAWPYSGKGEPANNEIPSGGLLEGGINLTALGLEGCFSSFMATSRSSAELTADLKDFILGSFEACDTELTTTPQDGLSTPAPLTDTNANSIPDIQIGTGAAGVDVSDSALIDVKGTTDWEGTLDFYLCGPIMAPVPDDPNTPEDESDPGDTCETGGVKIGDSIDVSDEGGTTYSSATANLTEVGYYCWRGEFLSETLGVPDATDDSSGECFEVLPVTPALSTQAIAPPLSAPVSGPISFGDPLYDKAFLTGTAHQPGTNGPGDADGNYTSINADMVTPAQGVITFELRGPDDGDTTVCTAADGEWEVPGENPGDVPVNGDGEYFSAGFTPDSPGDYHWVATYTPSEDDVNTLGTDHNTDCTDGDEDVTVQKLQPALSTAQTFVPNDDATVTVESGAGNLDGNVTFKLYVNDSDCAGGEDDDPVYTSGQIPVLDGDDSDGLSATVSSDNTEEFRINGTTFHWVVEFVSNNPAHFGVISDCVEDSSIAIDND